MRDVDAGEFGGGTEVSNKLVLCCGQKSSEVSALAAGHDFCHEEPTPHLDPAAARQVWGKWMTIVPTPVLKYLCWKEGSSRDGHARYL